MAGWLVLLGCTWECSGCGQETPPPGELLFQARRALLERDFERAERLGGLIPQSTAEWAPGQMIAGEAATKAGRLSDALDHYLAISSAAVPPADLATAQFSAAEIQRELGRLADAEGLYRAVLATSPDNVATHERLAFLLSATGRSWEAVGHYWILVKSGTAAVHELILLADPDRPFEQSDYLLECAAKAPDDGLVQLGLAAQAFRQGESPELEGQLRTALGAAPQQVAVQAMLGELLVDQGDPVFVEWHEGLPADASADPDIWYVRGLWARRRGELRVAARCFWEAVRRAPTHRRATHQLGQVLVALEEESGIEFSVRAKLLIQLTQTLDGFLRTGSPREDLYRRTTELMEAMGRVWEACAWALAARREFPDAEWPSNTFARLTGMLDEDLPLTATGANLALRYDLSRWPDHRNLIAARRGGGSRSDQAVRPLAAIRWQEQAAEAGIEFVYHNGPDPSTKGVRMFEQTGGGVAVLDIDRDGWPDVYFSQGADWEHGAPAPTHSAQYTDRMYRNASGAYVDSSDQARLGDQEFGQGCSAGDLDDDGFPDLYVANVGGNRLYRNNGDGTFRDVTMNCGLEGRDWTASCVIIDLNADGLQDLFDVNYVTGPGVYERICGGRACSPSVFEGVPDRLHINQGDGTFRFLPDVTPVGDSKGLGVVAACLTDRSLPCLFIANDQVPNFLLYSRISDNVSALWLEDRAVLSGVAYNEDGIAMAGMGIAADDADGDGRLDFFVTNFEYESNTLYLQTAPGLFADGTRPAGLREPSWPYVGWGTQFLDADLDGAPDIVVTNGHVDDYRDEGREYHMRAQFYWNMGGGRFLELAAGDVGEYFGRQHLGRGLARLDWNRDGQMDFVVSNIGERASLVTNLSEGVGRFLNVRLHATRTARDAIGTTVAVWAGGRRWRKQLVAGDGYMASNERVLQFGLGEVVVVDELEVQWPSGAASRLKMVPPEGDIDVVEGQRRAGVTSGGQGLLVPVELVPSATSR
jgi:tetratricopeptide (TPR) repeat protein